MLPPLLKQASRLLPMYNYSFVLSSVTHLSWQIQTISTSCISPLKSSNQKICHQGPQWETIPSKRPKLQHVNKKTFFIWVKSSLFLSYINQQNPDGDTPLHQAVKRHTKEDPRYDICEILLKNGAKPNIPDHKGKRPLDTAISNADQAMQDLLLRYKAIASL